MAGMRQLQRIASKMIARYAHAYNHKQSICDRCACVCDAREMECVCIGKGKSSMKTGTIIIITMIIDCDSIQIIYTNENSLIAFIYEIANDRLEYLSSLPRDAKEKKNAKPQ